MLQPNLCFSVHFPRRSSSSLAEINRRNRPIACAAYVTGLMISLESSEFSYLFWVWKFTPSPGWDLLIFGWIFPSPRNWIKIPKEIGKKHHPFGDSNGWIEGRRFFWSWWICPKNFEWFSGWWLNQPDWKNMLVKLGIFPKDPGCKKKYLKPPTRRVVTFQMQTFPTSMIVGERVSSTAMKKISYVTCHRHKNRSLAPRKKKKHWSKQSGTSSSHF